MRGIDEVLERLITEPSFRDELLSDPNRALAGYTLSPEDLELLAGGLSADPEGLGSVEQRTSKASMMGLISQLFGSLGGARTSAASFGSGDQHAGETVGRAPAQQGDTRFVQYVQLKKSGVGEDLSGFDERQGAANDMKSQIREQLGSGSGAPQGSEGDLADVSLQERMGQVPKAEAYTSNILKKLVDTADGFGQKKDGVGDVGGGGGADSTGTYAPPGQGESTPPAYEAGQMSARDLGGPGPVAEAEAEAEAVLEEPSAADQDSLHTNVGDEASFDAESGSVEGIGDWDSSSSDVEEPDVDRSGESLGDDGDSVGDEDPTRDEDDPGREEESPDRDEDDSGPDDDDSIRE